MRKLEKRLVTLTVALVVGGLLSPFFAEGAQTMDLPDGSKLNMSKPCPVCEMKLVPGPNSPAAVVFKDGAVVGLDANSDFFKYVLEPEKYKYSKSDIKSLFVMTMDGKTFFDATKVYFVIAPGDSGQMGAEIIAFVDKAEAEKFSKSKTGSKVVSFIDVSLSDVQPKKKMLKMKQSSPDPAKPHGSHGGH